MRSLYARAAATVGVAFLAMGTAACGPRARIPRDPAPVPVALAATDSQQRLMRALAPVLYLQPDEAFPLERVVAVHHPARPWIAYHLLWRDDVHGAWIPFTVPTDQEIVWVEHDGRGTPLRVYTFWHGSILHDSLEAPGSPEVNVQWGKHGSVPRGLGFGELPGFKTMNAFYALAIVGLPDIVLSRLQRRGPWGFFHGFGRYRQFTDTLPVAPRIDAFIVSERPHPVLEAYFGENYSKKRPWPWD